MEVSYQYVEDKNAFKKPKRAVVMFTDNPKPDSLYEHSISEFVQYADTYGYSFFRKITRLLIIIDKYILSKILHLLNYVINGLNTNE